MCHSSYWHPFSPPIFLQWCKKYILFCARKAVVMQHHYLTIFLTWRDCAQKIADNKISWRTNRDKKLELPKMLRDFLSCCASKSCVVFGKILISANKFGKRLLLKRQQQQRQRKSRRLLSRRRCSFCLGRRESARLRLPAQGMPTIGNVVFIIPKQNWFKLQDSIAQLLAKIDLPLWQNEPA